MKTSASLANALGHVQTDKRIEILRLVGETGSISKAAREAQVSYKAAWQAIDTLSNLSGIKLVEKVVGGVGGGGAKLTEAGAQLLTAADLLEQARQEVLDHLQTGKVPVSGSTLSQLAIRTSMRNHLPCRVKALENYGQIVRVFLEMSKGEQLVARITRASAELLALAVGQPILALCKATAVEIGHPTDFQKKPNRNVLHGRTDRISAGDTEDEIAVSLLSGLQLVGFAPRAKAIQQDDNVVAAIDESAIVVALTG